MKLTNKKHVLLSLLCFLILNFLQSCDKQHAKNLAGTYKCQVHYVYWDMTPNNIDSTYLEDLYVVREGKYLKVLDCKIHVDSLYQGQEYQFGEIHNYIKVQFKDKHLYVTRSSGGLGGNASRTYDGVK